MFGAIVLIGLALTTSDRPIEWNAEFTWALAFSTIAATAIGWWLWTYILQNTPAGIAGLNSLGIPVVAVLSSWVQLGERPPALELAGMLLIGFALALLAWLNLRNAART
jgi:drug/metabolite transporter (DMT)-like permease